MKHMLFIVITAAVLSCALVAVLVLFIMFMRAVCITYWEEIDHAEPSE